MQKALRFCTKRQKRMRSRMSHKSQRDHTSNKIVSGKGLCEVRCCCSVLAAVEKCARTARRFQQRPIIYCYSLHGAYTARFQWLLAIVSQRYCV